MGGRVRMGRGRVALVVAAVVAATGLGLVGASPPAGAAEVPIVAWVSAKADGTAPNYLAQTPFTERNGRFQGFVSSSTNLVPGLVGFNPRVYLRDRLTDEVELISVRADGTPSGNTSTGGAVTPDGRYVAFSTYDSLVPQDANAKADVYVRDRWTDTNELISVASSEIPGNDNSAWPNGDHAVDISDDGRYVSFPSSATNLVTGDVNGFADVFRRDRADGTTTLVSVFGAVRGNSQSGAPTMSANGRYVAFSTSATNLMANDTNGTTDVIRRDMSNLDNLRISQGQVVNPAGHSGFPSISDDGTRVAFSSTATDLVPGDTNAKSDVFVRNVSAGTTTRVSTTGAGGQLNGENRDPSIRPDGSGVGFTSAATNVAGDTNGKVDIYTKVGSTLTVVSRHPAGGQSGSDSTEPALSNATVMWSSQFAFSTSDLESHRDVWSAQQLFLGPHSTLTGFVTHQQTGFGAPTGGTFTSLAAARLRNGASPEHWVLGLAHATPFAKERAPVTRLYWSFFERRPDKPGLQYWLDQRTAGVGLNAIAQKFSQSPEFTTLYGNTSNTAFVNLVYENVLDRPASDADRTYWVGRLGGGLKRGDLMVLFSESPEGRAHMSPYVDTILLALGMYDAIPSKPLFDAAVDAVVTHDQPNEIIVDYILGAPEYAAAIA